MDLTIKDFLDILHGIGIPGILLLMAYLWLPKVGEVIKEVFLIPLRDALIGNISILTTFITDMKETIPELRQGQVMATAAMIRQERKDEDTSADNARTRATIRAVAIVMSNKCPDAAQLCPWKQKDVLGSDLFDKEKKREQPT